MNRNPVSQRALSLLLSLALVLSIFGVDTVGAYAAQSGSPTVLYLDSGNIVIDGANVTQNGQSVTRGTQDSGYLITQKDSGAIQHTITVQSGTQDITLQNVHAKPTGGAAFEVENGAEADITLVGSNSLDTSGSSSQGAGLSVNSGSTVHIVGNGSLTATGGYKSAGIGGNDGNNCGTVEISGGTVTANGGNGGAGIGGGYNGAGGTITISGGSVTATGGSESAGIGGGGHANASTVGCAGGTITVSGGNRGAGIGGGQYGAGGTITVSGGTVTANGGRYGAGIGGGIGYLGTGGSGGIVTISGTDTQVTAKGQDGGKDIGSGESGTTGGSLAVSDGATVAMLNTGTNANSPSYTDCRIITGSGSSQTETVYGGSNPGSRTMLTAALTAQPAENGAVTLTASVSPAEGGTFDFAYSGVKDSGSIEDGVAIGADGTATATWDNPPTDGLTVVTAKYKDSGSTYDALKAVFSYDPDAIDLSTVSSGGFGYTYGSNTVTINHNGWYVFTGSTSGATANKIAVLSGVSADVTLKDASIDVSGTNNACAFSIAKGAAVNLTLKGANTLKSGDCCAGLQVPGNASFPADTTKNALLTVTDTSDGSLNVIGGTYSAGLGGIYNYSGAILNSAGGIITINGGTVTAYGGALGAGIGGGKGNGAYAGGGGAGGIITINGGSVKATGGDSGAGIGGGKKGNGGIITINGGTVKATGGDSGAGIGGGSDGAGGTVYISGSSVKANGHSGGEAIGKGAGGTSGGTLQNNSTDRTPVYLTTVTLPSQSAALITGLSLKQGGSSYVYGINSMKADANGKLYLYLPANSGDEKTMADITADNTAYTGYYGSVTGAGTNVLKMEPTLSVSSRYIYGEAITPTVNGGSGGTFQYSGKIGSKTTYGPDSPNAPTDCGDYTVLATPAETDVYGTASADFSIIKATPSVSLSTQPQSGAQTGNTVTLTAKVKGINGHSPTGTVEFYDGQTKLLGTGNLSGGTATYTWSNVGMGDHTLKASYSGDGNYNPVDSSITYNIAKRMPKVDTAPSAASVPYGSLLSASTLTGGKASDTSGAAVPGKFTWAHPDMVVTVSGDYEATFTPDDPVNYNKVTGITVPLTVTAAPASGSHSSGSSTPSLPSELTDIPTNTTVLLSGAVFPSSVTRMTLSVTPETSTGVPEGVTGGTADPQGAAAYNRVLSDAALNVIGTPFLYNIQLLDQSGNPVSFTGSVTVKIPFPAGLRGTPRVFRYEESAGTFTNMNAVVENGSLVFNTDHFSYYVIAGTGDSITLDTKGYSMPVGSSYQIGVKLTGSKAASVKFHSTNDKIAAVAKLKNGNVQVMGRNGGTAWIMFDVYDNKNHLLTHASVKIDVKTGIRPRGDSTRQIGIF
ncbi:MAG TPA: Ig-like domain-containing protein [Caproiciproducens sp.]|nr:Ig-like domain-containing protein [Caproiciproducens sp.]